VSRKSASGKSAATVKITHRVVVDFYASLVCAENFQKLIGTTYRIVI